MVEGHIVFFYLSVCNQQIEYENKILRYSRAPLFGTLVIRMANYMDRLGPSGKYVENLQN